MNSTERYDYFKLQKRCTKCQKQDAYTLNGRAYCYECTQRNAENARQWREKNREKHKEYLNEYRKKLREARICYNCGKRPAEDGHKRCAVCRHKNNEQKRRKYNSYIDPAMCVRCHKQPKFADFELCEKCYMDSLKGSAAADAVRDNRDHPWRKVFSEK